MKCDFYFEANFTRKFVILYRLFNCGLEAGEKRIN